MNALTKLNAILLTLTTLAEQETARIRWMNIYSPIGGYRNIKHRSQKKNRILARQRN